MKTGCNPSPDLKIILETTILSISRGLPRLREITKTKDDFCRQQMAGTPIVLQAPPQEENKDAKGKYPKARWYYIYMYKLYK